MGNNGQQQNPTVNGENKKNQIGKILVGMGSILLLGATLFIGYRIFQNRSRPVIDNQIAEIPTLPPEQSPTNYPTLVPTLPASTPAGGIAAVVTPQPSLIATTATSPTQKVPTPTLKLIPTTTNTTNLPIAGNSFPTLFTAFFGILLTATSIYMFLAS